MRDWKPKVEEAPPIEPPDFEFIEIEAAKSHGGWGVWERMSPELRARLIAHECEKGMRDGFIDDWRANKLKQGDDGPGSKPKKGNARDAMFKAFGLG